MNIHRIIAGVGNVVMQDGREAVPILVVLSSEDYEAVYLELCLPELPACGWVGQWLGAHVYVVQCARSCVMAEGSAAACYLDQLEAGVGVQEATGS